MKSLHQRISELVDRLYNVRATTSKEGKPFGVTDAWNLFQTAIAELVKLIEELAKDLPGPEKKRIAMQYVEQLFDRIIVGIDIPYVPDFFEKILDKYLKKLFVKLADGAIDSIVTLLNNLGVFTK